MMGGRIQPRRVLVAGDYMMDRYTMGKVGRVSPEAPVAVVSVEEEHQQPGGAGNVILNLISLGMHVTALGAVGEDEAGRELREHLSGEGCDVRGVVTDASRPTPLKKRIMASGQQLVRVDYERVQPLASNAESRLINMLPELLAHTDAVAISDYGKGTLTDTLLQALISQAKQRNIPVIADPKGRQFAKYAGATVIKPNKGEAYAAAGLDSHHSLNEVADRLLSEIPMEYLLVTRSGDGISLFSSDRRLDFPVRVREVQDVTGAGDTVLAMLTAAMASGVKIEQAIPLANMAAGIAIERLGCARVSLQDLSRRVLEWDLETKIVPTGALGTLAEALQGEPCTLVNVGGHEISLDLLRQLKNVAQSGHTLLVSVPQDCDPDLLDVLAARNEVSWVVQGDLGPVQDAAQIEATHDLRLAIPSVT